MADSISFFFDEHIPSAVGEGLRHRGVDVLTVQEAGRCGFTDEEQLVYSTVQGRVILSFDRDYLALDARRVPHAGIVWCPANKYSISQLISSLMLVYSVLSRDEMRNHVEFL